MRLIKEGKKFTKATEIEAPCCNSILEVLPEDAIVTGNRTYEFKCCFCDTKFYYSVFYFKPLWKE